jgi:hypothetical protein
VRPPDPSEIWRQVDEICRTAPLDIARRRRELLRHIVKRTLAESPATETSIAIEVYKKDAAMFHPSIDAIARVETNKLRLALEEFYKAAGKNAPIRITIEKYSAVADYTEHYSPPPPSGRMRDDANSAGNRDPSVELTAKSPMAATDRLKLGDIVPSLPHPTYSGVYVTRLNEKGRLQLPDEFIQWLASDIHIAFLTTFDRKVVRIYSYAWATWLGYLRNYRPRGEWIEMECNSCFGELHPQGIKIDFGRTIAIPLILRELTGLDGSDLCIWKEDKYVALATENIWKSLKQG